MADVLDEIRGILKENLAVLGEERTIKLLRAGKIKKVFVAANVSASVKGDLRRYGQLSNVAVVDLSLSNEEIGILCKKPFLISVIGVRHE